MTTNYDVIAVEYQQSKLQPWRTYIESPSLMSLVGDLSGKRVVDLACGEGYYTRQYADRGAQRVLGVDLSPRMIELARQQEAAAPRGAAYRVADVTLLDVALPELSEAFDLAAAAYLLNYARDRQELSAMCCAVAWLLRSGGRFVAINGNPALFSYSAPDYRGYGFETRVAPPVSEGAAVTWTFHVNGSSASVENYYLSKATHEAVLAEAGFLDVRWHEVSLDPRAAEHFEPGYWDAFLVRPPVILLECVKA
jgi:SAM-dependent methyltransferase